MDCAGYGDRLNKSQSTANAQDALADGDGNCTIRSASTSEAINGPHKERHSLTNPAGLDNSENSDAPDCEVYTLESPVRQSDIPGSSSQSEVRCPIVETLDSLMKDKKLGQYR